MNPIPHDWLERPAADPALWPLTPGIDFLNHGSFGSCPLSVLEEQRRWRDRLESQPIHFFVREMEGMLDAARAALAGFVGAQSSDLVFVTNATTGINAVLRSLTFHSNDELVVTDHEYNASRNILDFVAAKAGARVVVASIPFPLDSPEQVVSAVMEKVTPRTRLVLLDHVTSQTGLVMPIATIVRELNARGVESLIDGAHAPGMIPVDLTQLNATYYTGNCHKWICAPKGAGFLWVTPPRQQDIRPAVISHGANSPRTDRSRFLIEFGWTGTGDPTAWLSVPAALQTIGSLLPGGWTDVMNRNRSLALSARRILCESLSIDPPAPDEIIGSLASVPLPDTSSGKTRVDSLYVDAAQTRLWEHHRIEVPFVPWPAPPKRLLRISAQLYNSLPQYRRLANTLREVLA